MSEVDYSMVEFIDAQEREYFEEARLAIEFKHFLNSEVGRFLHGRAKIDVEEAKEKILELNPLDTEDQKKILQAQKDAACGTAFMRWCAEAIQNGLNAEQQLKNEYDR